MGFSREPAWNQLVAKKWRGGSLEISVIDLFKKLHRVSFATIKLDCMNPPQSRGYSAQLQAIVSTTPPSTRSAAPVVADASGEAA